MHAVKGNIFAFRAALDILRQRDSEDTKVGEMRILIRILGKLEKKVLPLDNYILIKGQNETNAAGEKYKVAFPELHPTKITHEHWRDKKHPPILIEFEEDEMKVLKSAFSDEKSFSREYTNQVMLFVEALDSAEPRSGK